MSTDTTPAASAPPVVDEQLLAEGAALLVGEIERFLAARTRATALRTAHPLVTKTTAALVDEALATAGPAAAPQELARPSRMLRLLPDRALRALRRTATSAGRPLSVGEHLELVALTIESYGWATGTLRTRSGRRCMAGAQRVLLNLGYGDERLVAEAGRHLDQTLAQRGERGPYWDWNDRPGRTKEQVLNLLRTGAATATEVRR